MNERILKHDSVVLELEAIAKRHPEQACAAGKRVWARARAWMEGLLEKTRTRIQGNLLALDLAREAVLGERTSALSDPQVASYERDLREYQRRHGDLAAVSVVSALVLHRTELSRRRWQETQGRDMSVDQLDDVRQRYGAELDIKTDNGVARAAFALARELHTIALQDADRVRTLSEWWEVAVLELLLYSPDTSARELGIESELPWGRWHEKGDDLFDSREGMRDYVGAFGFGTEEEIQNNCLLLAERAALFLGAWSKQQPVEKALTNPAAEEEGYVAASNPAMSQWASARTGGMPLRGWDEILGHIKAKKGRSQRLNIKRLNHTTGGPIRWCGGTPEVDAGEVAAWIEDIDGRNAALERNRSSIAAAAAELSERGGARAGDYGAHIEERPNARGKPKN